VYDKGTARIITACSETENPIQRPGPVEKIQRGWGKMGTNSLNDNMFPCFKLHPAATRQSGLD
jgi:hypothetical protein